MNAVVDLKTLKKFINDNKDNKNFIYNGISLIERIIYLQNYEALKYLLSLDVNIIVPKLMEEPIKYNNKKIIDELIDYSTQSYEVIDNEKHNAFHYAIKYNNQYVINLLIDKVNLFTTDINNDTYLHYSIKHNNTFTTNMIIDKILQSKHYELFNTTNNNNDTPLFLMIKNKLTYKINELIDILSINLNIQNNQQENILLYSCFTLNTQLIDTLISTINYVNWNVQDKDGNTVIHILIKYDRLDLVMKIIKSYANINFNIYNINYENALLFLLRRYRSNPSKLINNKNLVNILILKSMLSFDKKGNSVYYYIIKYYPQLSVLFNHTLPNYVNNNGVSLKDIDKDKIFEYENIIKPSKQYTTSSAMPFDILCHLSNCIIKNAYVYIDDNITSSINESLMNSFLIWSDDELINDYLIDKINDFNKSNKEIMILFLIIKYPSINHANTLIISKKEKLIYRYDPYGYYYSDTYNLKKLDKVLTNKIKSLKSKYNINYEYEYSNNKIGIQQKEETMKQNINDLNGYCISWCSIMVNNILLNNSIDLRTVIERFNVLLTNNRMYEYELNNEQETTNKLRDVILSTCNINFNDYINDKITLDQSKEMMQIYLKILSTYKRQ